MEPIAGICVKDSQGLGAALFCHPRRRANGKTGLAWSGGSACHHTHGEPKHGAIQVRRAIAAAAAAATGLQDRGEPPLMDHTAGGTG